MKIINSARAAVLLTLFTSGLCSAVMAQTITSYDATNVQASGFGGWGYTYDGSITVNGSGLVNLSGGSGTLNDGINPTSEQNNELFSIEDHSVITLHLDQTSAFSSFEIFGSAGDIGNTIPGVLTGVTVTIGGTSLDLTSSAAGPTCMSGSCDDIFSLSGTALAGTVGNTITLSNFQGNWAGLYNIGEITVTAAVSAVPEPETYGMLLAGLGLVGFMTRRKGTANT
jgi:hypothetical protein